MRRNALVAAGSPFVAALLRNFASFGAALTGITVVLIAGDSLGATGGLNGEVFTLAVARATEICLGIVCSGAILAVTDLGGARRRLSELLVALLADITAGFTRTVALAEAEMSQSQSFRRELARRTIALDPVIDQAIGESYVLHAQSPMLQAALSGLLTALGSWRAVSVRLAQQPNDSARQEARAILRDIAPELRSVLQSAMPRRWIADPGRLREVVKATMQTLYAAPAGTPSLRLFANQTAKVLTGAVDALDALALLTGAGPRPDRRRHVRRLYVPDWLPAFVNAGRAFLTIAAVAQFWIASAWPNGATSITLAAVVVITFAPRGDQAAAISMSYMAGVSVACVFAAIMQFVALPRVETFEAFSIIIGVYLIPVGALMSPQRQAATLTTMATSGIIYFVVLLAPANQMTYDAAQLYNSAVAILAGAGAATLSFRLLPPPSPQSRTRRLLAVTLRDLRRLATGPLPPTSDDWEGLIYSRIAVAPDATSSTQEKWVKLSAMSASRKDEARRGAGRDRGGVRRNWRGRRGCDRGRRPRCRCRGGRVPRIGVRGLSPSDTALLLDETCEFLALIEQVERREIVSRRRGNPRAPRGCGRECHCLGRSQAGTPARRGNRRGA
jgi:uncharacterized membrane protein YccC